MKHPLTVLLIFILFSCNSNQTIEHFQLLTSKLRTLDNGFSYDLVKEDAENCYFTNLESDTLFYNFNKLRIPILGILPGNSDITSIIHLEPGEDFHPTLRTFSKEGQMIAEQFIDYSDCVNMGCNYIDCSEIMTVVNDRTIEDKVKLVLAPCDNSGNKLMDLSGVNTEIKTKLKIIMVDSIGRITTKERVE